MPEAAEFISGATTCDLSGCGNFHPYASVALGPGYVLESPTGF